MPIRPQAQTEFGDFQTPLGLATEICQVIAAEGFSPASVLEPTCGTGSFLIAALSVFPSLAKVVGTDINIQYLEEARSNIARLHTSAEFALFPSDFFTFDWSSLFSSLPRPILVLGNPPWVTNSRLSTLSSLNVPTKSNFQNLAGLDAMTGKSNFDISEWIIVQILTMLPPGEAKFAMLCKTGVARRALSHCWRTALPLESHAIRLIDAAKHFAIAADACLYTCDSSVKRPSFSCAWYSSLQTRDPDRFIGFRDGRIIADIDAYSDVEDLRGADEFKWRSGIKHDASKIMVFTRQGSELVNGFGQPVQIEATFLYPMLKSSDLARVSNPVPHRWMLVPQSNVSEDTGTIKHLAPQTWTYLQRFGNILDSRKSSVYRRRPRFAVFGVGDYAFKPWKVAISGLHKFLSFALVPPFQDRPVVFDDTSYFLSWSSREQAEFVTFLLRSDEAQRFLRSLIFWDAKRPITADILDSLDITALAAHLGQDQLAQALLRASPRQAQLPLLNFGDEASQLSGTDRPVGPKM